MKLSIVATLYQSAPHLEEFVRRASESAHRLEGDDYEIILVNDGSPDNSLAMAITLSQQDTHIIVVDLSRNFGHHKAMLAGLGHARGERIFLIDSDLEEDPEWLLTFAEQMQKEDCDVVFGVQRQRKGGWFERWSGWLFYSLFNAFSDVKLQKNAVTARLMSKRYKDALLLHREHEVSIGGLYVLTGFKQCGYTIDKHDTSASTYTFRRKMAILVNSITSFSNKPLVGIFYIGITIFTCACLYSGYLVINWLFLEEPLIGWTSVMASIWLLGGLVISLIGIIGIYLAKIFMEIKQRPNHIIRHVYGGEKI